MEAWANDRRHGNWIGGAEVPSKEGLFEVFARDGSGQRLGEWPRSGPREVELALGALGAGAPNPVGLLELGRSEIDRALASRLGLDESEFERLLSARGTGQFGVGIQDGVARRVQVHVFAAGRSMLPGEIVWRVGALRAAGTVVLVLGARQLPMAATAAVKVLMDAGLGGLGLGLLHGVTAGGWREIGARTLSVSGSLDRDERAELTGSALQVAGLARLLGQLGEPTERCFRVGFEGLSRRSGQGRIGALAKSICERAFGRGAALGGWGHGAGLLGLVEERHYSALVDQVLLQMEQGFGGLAGFPGEGQGLRYRASLGAALDQGGCLLTGGSVLETAAGSVLEPGLLVNLPLECAGAQVGEPLALLRLLRD